MDPNDNELSDFLSSVPPALTLALVQLAPCISLCKAALEISSWSLSSWYSSWLALAAWWALCLFLDKTLRLFLPLIFFAFAQRRPKKVSGLQPPTTEKALQTVITDLTIIQSLLPCSPAFPSLALPSLLRASVLLSIPYILLSLVVPLRVILAIAGTLLLTWRAPWAILLRATVWHSAWFRWALYKSWSLLTGTPLPARTLSPQTLSSNVNSDSGPVQSLRFLFTVCENQRWWMGLDWTAALLPGERPSWCSASPAQHPLSPPNAFTLPENTTVYLPDEKGGKGARVKRTATWKWEEPEWRVVVHKDGAGLSRVDRPLPDENPGANSGGGGSRLLKAAGRLRESSSSGSMGSTSAPGEADATGNKTDPASKEIDDDEPLTDPDGWVYGDNKWEAQSNRGGMGKYTRFRRWTRVAVVFEVVERIPASAPTPPTSTSTGDPEKLFGIQKQKEQVDPPLTAKPIVTETFSTAPEVTTTLSTSPLEGSVLKQRLKMALNQNKGSAQMSQSQ